MKKYISKLHYLTQDLPGRGHVEQVIAACEAGANWVQYRCLTKTDDELLNDIHQIAAICDDWGATLIITNHVHLLAKADVQGVHIEDMDADFAKIREQVGEDKTLGGSANTFEQIRRGFETGAVDYFGCGPFAVTLTKPNSYPILGVGGYRDIVARTKSEDIDIPLLAVGGVGLNDVDDLLQTGVYGIAVSAAVNLADDPASAMRDFYRKVF
ncbi:MAG: thiamine phosphate synthase [Sphingobacteriaceae bacterium]|nr:thiamine phosphate synthase [Sphingobacteriaceae bacterium]